MNTKFLNLAERLANMTRDGEEGYVAADDTDLPRTMDALIKQAREALNRPVDSPFTASAMMKKRAQVGHALRNLPETALRNNMVAMVPKLDAHTLDQFYRRFVMGQAV